MRPRAVAVVVAAVVIIGCGPVESISSPSPSATAPTSSSASSTPTREPSASASPTPSAATASPAPTAAPTASAASERAPYCAVADVPASNTVYADHAKTALDWTYALPKTYVPPDLVSAITGGPAPGQFALPTLHASDVMARRGDPAYTTLLKDDASASIRAVAYGDLMALRAAAAAAGRAVIIISSYRSYDVQQLTFNYWVGVGGYEQALRTSARPGHSEHQLGTVVDFGDGVNAPWEYADWATTPIGGWLAEHAWEYGFVMSFQKGKSDVTCYDYEPWHYRWVGKDLAQKLMQARVTLREFQARSPS